MTTFLISLICKIQEQVSTWEKMNLMLEPFDDLENKMIILEGDFNLSLDSALEAEGVYTVLKKSSVSMLLILKKNTTYVKRIFMLTICLYHRPYYLSINGLINLSKLETIVYIFLIFQIMISVLSVTWWT